MEDILPIFFNVNTQRDFFTGSYKVPSAENILDNLNDLTQYAKINHLKVVSVAGWYTENSKHLSDNPNYKDTFPKHCLINTEGAKFLKETSPDSYFLMDWNSSTGIHFHEMHQNDNVVVTKKTMDFFEGNPYSESLVHNLGIPIRQRPVFLVYGIDIGPTVKGLLRRGYTVKVVSDANRTLQGLPFKKEDVIDIKPNPYPDQIVAPLIDNTPLEFVTTNSIISV